jgi:hypothetical protein
MGWQTSLLAPPVNRVFCDTKVLRHLLGGNPRLGFHFSALTRLKSA